jgi:ribosomal protein S18 acetylase RimI-like enzyme
MDQADANMAQAESVAIMQLPSIPDRAEHEGGVCAAPAFTGLLERIPEVQPGRVNYCKRFRMEVELSQLPAPVLPPGYEWVPWRQTTLQSHAEALFSAFYGEIDTVVFPSLSSVSGCYCLMDAISRRSDFLPEATWLVTRDGNPCGSVQGVREQRAMGAIQNLGIKPEHRGHGLGEALLLRALEGFRNAGLARSFLEVTARNDAAIRLYRRLGFRRCKTLYKAIPGGAVV